MAKNNFETPEVRTFPVIPKLENSAQHIYLHSNQKKNFKQVLVILESL
jgi:hypothetical protein